MPSAALRRYRLRLTSGGHWIEGTWAAPTRAEAERLAAEWAARWMRFYHSGDLSITDGET